MTANKHTPGPWVFYADTPSAEPNWHIVTTANRMRVVANVHIDPSSEMDTANARLIAAAPELLEALIEAVECGMVPISSAVEGGASAYSAQVRCADKIRAAIAKATGETP